MLVRARRPMTWAAGIALALVSAVALPASASSTPVPSVTSASKVPAPTTSPISHIVAVACPSASRCEALGFYQVGATGTNRFFVTQFNGTSWSAAKKLTFSDPSLVSSINVGFPYAAAISCGSTTSCVAVGNVQTNVGTMVTLTWQFNGSTWSAGTTLIGPPDFSPNGYMVGKGVACPTASTCVVVG